LSPNVTKTFTMHLRDAVVLPWSRPNVSFSLKSGECVVLGGPSGAGKSSILKMLYGNYGVDSGQVIVSHHGGNWSTSRPPSPRTDSRTCGATRSAMSASSCALCRVCRQSMSSRNRCLRSEKNAKHRETRRAGAMLARLNLPGAIVVTLPPATFSGGEQQRVNIARGFITDHPILLLDEPTASLDAANREIVVGMIAEKKQAGAALLGIFHDQDVREAVADCIIDVTGFAPQKAAA
jgi:alpha-D-ribose 1-methylphosphonate 5-triphosphate synthase subunit PhnL